MKRYIAAMILLLFCVGFASADTTSGTVSVQIADVGDGFKTVVWTWTSDADGYVTDNSASVVGEVVQVVTNPGSPAPTDNWDVAINDSGGYDMLGGLGADRDDTDTEIIFPVVSVSSTKTEAKAQQAVTGTEVATGETSTTTTSLTHTYPAVNTTVTFNRYYNPVVVGALDLRITNAGASKKGVIKMILKVD